MRIKSISTVREGTSSHRIGGGSRQLKSKLPARSKLTKRVSDFRRAVSRNRGSWGVVKSASRGTAGARIGGSLRKR